MEKDDTLADVKKHGFIDGEVFFARDGDVNFIGGHGVYNITVPIPTLVTIMEPDLSGIVRTVDPKDFKGFFLDERTSEMFLEYYEGGAGKDERLERLRIGRVTDHAAAYEWMDRAQGKKLTERLREAYKKEEPHVMLR